MDKVVGKFIVIVLDINFVKCQVHVHDPYNLVLQEGTKVALGFLKLVM
jgi:hypothetical protein